MTKKQERLLDLEIRIGQLEGHIKKYCPIPSLLNNDALKLSGVTLDKEIAKRLAWLRENNEKERMGRRRG